MRKKSIAALLGGVALSIIALAGVDKAMASAESKPDPAANEKPFDIDAVNNFSGAYLAALTADTDGDYKNAIDLYKVALEFEQNDLRLQERLMVNLFLNGQFDDGVALAKTLRKDQAVERLTAIALGLDAIRKHEYSKARKLLVYDGPNDLDRMLNGLLTAWADFGAGRKKDALAEIDKLNGPDWFKIFKNYHAGVMAQLAGDNDAARSFLKSAITDKEGGAAAQDIYVRSVIALATLEMNAGNKQPALDAISAGEELTGRYAPFQTIRDMIDKGQSLKPEVASVEEGAAAVMFSVGGALNQSVAGNADMRNSAQEIVSFYLQGALALDPNSADTMIILGNVADGANKAARAIEYYQKVDASSPMHRISELQLGLDLSQLGKNDEAEQHLKALIAEDPSDFRSYLALGSVYADKENYTAMAATYDDAVKAIGVSPTRSQWNIFYQRGIAYERLKKWADAEPNFKKALELFPDQPQVLNYLGYSWIDMNINLDEGMAMIKKAVDLRPDDGYIIDSLGWAYYRTGKYDDAVKELQRAVQLKESDATINDHYGDALWRAGRKLEATFQWNRALIAKPDAALEAKLKDKLKNGLPDLNGKTPAEADAAKVQTPAADPAAGKKS